MLISLHHRFIFVANIKAASSSIESALADISEICIDQTRFGKHASLGEIERRFASIFDIVPRPLFRVFGVVRDPVDWVYSLYRSHKSIPFENSGIDTAGISFDQFLTDWIEANPGHVVPQRNYFNDMAGRFAADYLIRFDRLNEDFSRLLDILHVPSRSLGHFNVSVDLPETEAASADVQQALYARYHDDALLTAIGGRWLNDEDRSNQGRYYPTADAFALSEAEARPRIAGRKRAITRDDVIWAYRMLLNRDPESNSVIEEHCALGTRAALRTHLMRSEEFRNLGQP